MKKRKTEIERIRALRSDIVEIESGDLVPGIPPTSPEEWMLLEIRHAKPSWIYHEEKRIYQESQE